MRYALLLVGLLTGCAPRNDPYALQRASDDFRNASEAFNPARRRAYVPVQPMPGLHSPTTRCSTFGNQTVCNTSPY